MSIQEKWSNFKQSERGSEVFLVFIILGVGLGSFWLGRASVSQNVPTIPPNSAAVSSPAVEAPSTPQTAEIPISEPRITPEPTKPAVPTPTNASTEGNYVASKSGTKYHLPWCAGAKAIKESNKIWFATKAEAEAAGYTPAANCKGI